MRPSDYATPSERVQSGLKGERIVTDRPCDLCQLAHYTQWYAEFHHPFRFTILDCDSCDVPIAVLGEHRTAVTAEEVAYMEKALNFVAEQKFAGKFPKWVFDHQ